ncbi:uncharacterized protein THITE_2106500 [Thermothielavioides terrestris NRRL 8126]|uniref:C2H2-type domain-containing protein n=1 Tax=Thermothielavioides terrestris (strain ATCC 38088 / NRRL 8126) TaxID=578455 RepID=G2QQH9_THETT|nr:uncharacterized protein THITE_2106500 [Thermothielavioides terrestris NRRL 8126]AEO62389.1 hypothetical protein THITE_2106500 [Thermothielavioides terrestris NRRL 8126]
MERKHQARHKKPFKCDIEGCQKETEGFSTSNDLDRHKRCVHKLLKPGEVVYRCDLGSCKDKEKDWPRQDNFKQHLKRKHDLEGVDLSRFIFRSSDAADPTDPGASETFSGDTSAVANSDAASSWLGLDHAHVSPASLTTRIPSFAQTGGMTQFPRNPVMEERDFTLPRAVDSSRLSGSAGLEVGPVLSDAGIPQVSARGEIAPAIDTLSRVGDPAWVAPDSLSQTQPETRAFGPQLPEASPRQVAELEVDDEGPDVAAEDAQSERAEAESAVPDEMELDNPAQDSMSEDNLHDPDSEDDGPSDSTTDGQADLLRDTGAQYSSVDGVHLKSPSTEMQLAADAPRPIDLDDESQASAVLRSLMEKGMLGKLLKEVGYRAAEEAETKAKEQRPPANSSAPSDGSRVNKCQDCPKTFVRRCELKKHQKRHARPYACTFAKCDKTFGSKNDWKRHENSQHFQLEIWRCAEKASGAAAADQECGKVCHRRESLKSHLERDHGIHDPATLERKLADCRMGRNFESRFWCGFCQKTIEPTGKGGPAHSERFDHIDDHFNGRGVPKADIKDWKHVDTDPLESSSSSPDGGSPGRGRRDGSARGGRPEWVHVPRSASGFRKRPHSSGRDGEASSRAKRAKNGRGGKRDTWWSCCSCKMYWSLALTNKCMDPCNHDHCSACEIFERSSTELRVQVRAPGQDQDMAQDQDTAQENGLMA